MNMPPHCDMIIPMLKSEFGDLWSCRPCSGGRVVHVQTPFSTPTDKFVSVYIEKRSDEWIISDGGYLVDEDNSYSFNQFNDPEKTQSVLNFLADEYDILETKGAGRIYYYMKTTDERLIASRVSDVSAFIASAVSALHCSDIFASTKERAPLFHTQANSYFRVHIPNLETNVLYSGIKHRYPARKTLPNFKHVVLSYVTGTTKANFDKALSQSIVYTELLWKTHRTSVHSTVTFLDNEAGGYRHEEQKDLCQMLTEKSHGVEPVLWGDRDSFVESLAEMVTTTNW